MHALLEIGLCNALAATALALAAAAVGLHCRRPALAHSLWLLVLLKLVTPPLVSLPVDWPASLAIRAEQAALPAEPPQAVGVMQEYGSSQSEILPSEVADVARLPTMAELALKPRPGPVTGLVPPNMTSSWRVRPWAGIAVLWLAGTVLYAGVTTARLVRFGTLARQARLAPEDLCARVEQLAAQLGLASAPVVGLVAGRIAPLLWAVGGAPRLLLPEKLWARLDCDQRDALLLHELAHLRRRDHWVRMLELLVTSLYWWHPVVWWARSRLRQFEEECCDAWVVHARPGSVRSYATALVETLDFLAESRAPVPVAASGLGHFWSLKRRLAMILDATTPPALSVLARLAVLGLAALLLPLAPAWAQAPATSPVDSDAQAPATSPTTPAADTAPVIAAQPAVPAVPAVPVRSDDELPAEKALPRATTPRAARGADTAPAEVGANDFNRTEIARQYARVDEAKLAVVRAQSELINAQRRLAELQAELDAPRPEAGADFGAPAGPSIAGRPRAAAANRRAGAGRGEGRGAGSRPNDAGAPVTLDGLSTVRSRPVNTYTDQRLDALEQKFDAILRELERLKRADRPENLPEGSNTKLDAPQPSIPRNVR